MLQEMDSLEYSRWIAFERVYGPIGGQWTEDAIAALHEQLQQISYLLGQAHFADKQSKKGPIKKPERYPRPYEALVKPPEVVIDDDEDEWLPPSEEIDACPPDCACKSGGEDSEE